MEHTAWLLSMGEVDSLLLVPDFCLVAAKSLQSCPTLCNPIDDSPPGSPIPGILQARTRVGCHFLLQYMKVKSESEVAQSCPTLSDPLDCSLPGSSIHGTFQARVLEWGAIAFSVCLVTLCLFWNYKHLWVKNFYIFSKPSFKITYYL